MSRRWRTRGTSRAGRAADLQRMAALHRPYALESAKLAVTLGVAMKLAGRTMAAVMLLASGLATAPICAAAGEAQPGVAAAPASPDQMRAARAAARHRGDRLIAQGDLDDALDDVEDEVGISRRLAAADPGAPAQRDLVLSLNRLAWLFAAQSDLISARRAYD